MTTVHARSFSFQPRNVFIAFILLCIFVLSGCATSQNTEDPYEGYNRKVFAFNMKVDKYVYRPVAKTYDFITPTPVRRGVNNFFANINQLPVIGNDLLQGNVEWFVSDIGRLIVNTTLGVGGLFDVATKAGIEKHRQDFGLTLAKWGFRESAYLMIPFLPSTTPRDLIGFGADYFMTPWPYLDSAWWTYAAYGIEFIDTRASVLGIDNLIEEAFDPYVFVRDAYLQRRESQIQKILDPQGNAEFSENTVEGDFNQSDASSDPEEIASQDEVTVEAPAAS